MDMEFEFLQVDPNARGSRFDHTYPPHPTPPRGFHPVGCLKKSSPCSPCILSHRAILNRKKKICRVLSAKLLSMLRLSSIRNSSRPGKGEISQTHGEYADSISLKILHQPNPSPADVRIYVFSIYHPVTRNGGLL